MKTRETTGTVLAAVAVALLIAVATGVPARAEASYVRGEGWHRVEHEAWIDLGRFVDCVTWRYVVKENETLGEIAQRELGSAQRHREILALNAGLEPKKLWAGERIVMPPRPRSCEGRGPKWIFFAWSPDPNGWAAARQLVEGSVHRVSHGARMYAVPAARLHAVLGQATEQGLDGRVLEREVGVARSGFVTLVDALPDVDPTQRIVTRWRVQDVIDGEVVLARVAEERFDADGRPVAVASGSSRPSTFLLILSFGLILAVAGFGVARTQRLRHADDETLEDDVEATVEDPVAMDVDDEVEAEADLDAYEDGDDLGDEDELYEDVDDEEDDEPV